MKTLSKMKIVRNEDIVTCYFWKKVFWVFGYWQPHGSYVNCEAALSINDYELAIIMYNQFRKHKSNKPTTEY